MLGGVAQKLDGFGPVLRMVKAEIAPGLFKRPFEQERIVFGIFDEKYDGRFHALRQFRFGN